jgi:hypothetical protein
MAVAHGRPESPRAYHIAPHFAFASALRRSAGSSLGAVEKLGRRRSRALGVAEPALGAMRHVFTDSASEHQMLNDGAVLGIG